MFGKEYDMDVWQRIHVERIKEYGMRWWMNDFAINDKEQDYLKFNRQPKNEKYTNVSVGAKVILMVWGGCLPVRVFFKEWN